MCFTGDSDCLRETVTKTFSILGAKGRKKPLMCKKKEKQVLLYNEAQDIVEHSNI